MKKEAVCSSKTVVTATRLYGMIYTKKVKVCRNRLESPEGGGVEV
jgi:hypothetical protein